MENLSETEKERLCRKRLQVYVLKKKVRATRSVRSAQALGVAVRNECNKLEKLQQCVGGSGRAGLECFETKQDHWDQSIYGELVEMAKEQGIPIHAQDTELRSPRRIVSSKSQTTNGLYEQKFLYDSKDLLIALTGSCSAIHQSEIEGINCMRRQWSANSFGLAPKTIQELRRQLGELNPKLKQVGVDNNDDAFMQRHEALGTKLLKIGSIQLVERYLRQGSSAALRAKLYRLVLQDSSRAFATSKKATSVPETSTTNNTASDARKRVEKKSGEENAFVFNSTVVDRLHALDLELIRNNDNYFVFEDLLRNILPVLFRDHMDWLRLHSRVVSRLEHMRAVPYYGFALQAAPLAYLFKNETEIVLCLRAMFARYWCQLNVLRNSPVGTGLTLLPNLCAQFEYLVQQACPRAVYHLHGLGVNPIDIAFEWIHLGFASALSVDSLLNLWDRILGFDSLLPLPVLAAAIFKYREDSILRMTTEKQVLDLMKQTAHLNVVALLQAFLFT